MGEPGRKQQLREVGVRPQALHGLDPFQAADGPRTRPVSVVEHVVVKSQVGLGAIEIEVREVRRCRVADAHLPIARVASQSYSDLAPAAEHPAGGQTATVTLHADLFDLLTALEATETAAVEKELWRNEVPQADVQRLVELRQRQRRVADLGGQPQLAGAAVERGLEQAHADIPGAVAFEIGRQDEAELEVIGPPALIPHMHEQPLLALFFNGFVTNTLEDVPAV